MAIGLDFCVGCGCSLYFQDEIRRYCPSCEEAEMVYPVVEYVDLFEDHPEVFKELCAHWGIVDIPLGKVGKETICQEIESWPEILF